MLLWINIWETYYHIEGNTLYVSLKQPLYGWADVSMKFVFAQNMDMSIRFHS